MNFIFFNLLLLLAGFPASFLIERGMKAYTALLLPFLNRENPRKAILFPTQIITFFFLLYLWGMWACFCVAVTMKFTQKPDVTWDWLYWFCGFGWCWTLVEWMFHKQESTAVSIEEVDCIKRSTKLQILINIAAFIIFAFAPNLTKWPYGWFINGTGLSKHMYHEATENAGKETVNENEVLAFRKSITLRNEAMAQLGDKNELSEIKTSDIKSAMRLLNQSLEESNSVSKRTLALFDEELPVEYREKFLKGISVFMEGIQANDDDMLVEGQNLMNEFGEFYTKMNRQKKKPSH